MSISSPLFRLVVRAFLVLMLLIGIAVILINYRSFDPTRIDAWVKGAGLMGPILFKACAAVAASCTETPGYKVVNIKLIPSRKTAWSSTIRTWFSLTSGIFILGSQNYLIIQLGCILTISRINTLFDQVQR